MKVKVIDFGSATYVYEDCQDYVQTRPYRAPEVIFGCEYDFSADMWSFGCILYELLTSKVLFRQKDLHQIIAQSISLSLSRTLYQNSYFKSPFKPYDSFGASRKRSEDPSSLVTSKFESPSSFHRKAEILSRDSNDFDKKNSSRQGTNQARAGTEDEISDISQENKSGKTEVRKVWDRSRAQTGGEKSNVSNDTRRNENNKGCKGGKGKGFVHNQFSKIIRNVFETFREGKKYTEMVCQGRVTRSVDSEEDVSQAEQYLAAGQRDREELQFLPHQ